MDSKFFDQFYPGQIRFGMNCAESLGPILAAEKIRKILLVTDLPLVEIGTCRPVIESLDAARIRFEVFDEAGIEPSTTVVDRVVEVAKQGNVDGLVAVGGGSVMDLAKLSGAVVAGTEPSNAYFGFDRVRDSLPVICLPTTAGTGSEVSHAAIIFDELAGTKKSVLSQRIRPSLAIVDPQLCLTCPKTLTAESGIDALTHAIEAFLVTDAEELGKKETKLPYAGKNPIADLYAAKSIELISENLEKAVNTPCPQSRAGMSLAATLAGLAFSNAGVTLVHALEYPVGSRYKSAHGAGNGILLPGFLRFILESRRDEISRIGEMMNVGPNPDAVIDRIIAIRGNCRLPDRLSQLGAAEADLPVIAETAFTMERLMDLCPRAVDNNGLLQILRNSL
ncbi:MAG: iron-containing alcohol dehydrogenase [Planctomycetota bacterium]|nr:iron-containing alcohol dehydrogenase [Planctomycetota bacterium]